MQTHYELMSIDRTASPREVEEAYRRQSKNYHPDKVTHLGREFQALAASKMVLLNEAYRVLGDPESRARYDGHPEAFEAGGYYVVCRVCGCPAWLPENARLRHEKCTSCGRALAAQAKRQGCHLWKDLAPILDYLRLSQQRAADYRLASSFQVLYHKTAVTLDRMPDGKWCLFTQSRVIHARWAGSPWQRPFDEGCGAGFCFLPAPDPARVAGEVQKLLRVLGGERLPVAALIPGERKDGAAEPNMLLLSALTDGSYMRAREIWKASGGNLFACEFEPAEGWEARLEGLFDLAYAGKRKSVRPTAEARGGRDRATALATELTRLAARLEECRAACAQLAEDTREKHD